MNIYLDFKENKVKNLKGYLTVKLYKVKISLVNKEKIIEEVLAFKKGSIHLKIVKKGFYLNDVYYSFKEIKWKSKKKK